MVWDRHTKGPAMLDGRLAIGLTEDEAREIKDVLTRNLHCRGIAQRRRALGIGYASKGLMKGYVAIPIRLPTGELTGYIGISEAKLPKSSTFPTWSHFQRRRLRPFGSAQMRSFFRSSSAR
jgi:hypothetical protein